MRDRLGLSQTAAQRVWSLLVAGRHAPDAHCISLVGDERQTFTCRPGQWLKLALPTDAGPLQRVGRIEAFDPEELQLDISLCDPVATRWAEGAAIGDAVTAELVAA